MKRRQFIKTAVSGSSVLLLPVSINAINKDNKHPLKFGICADVHKDIMHDADSRLKAFIDEANSEKLDFIIQLGDFCRPYDYNRGFMDIWNSFKGKTYHVLGNHDMDGGFTREQVIDYWESEGKYYSFDMKGIHFIVLDGNDLDDSNNRADGYSRFIGNQQLEWLENDLNQTDLPTIIFSHQGLDNDINGITNATKSRLVLERSNKKAGWNKVKIVFSGHHHQDYHNVFNGINYVQINSMSNQWLGDKYKHIRYSEEVDKTHPYVKYTVPYKDPLWATVEISGNNMLKIIGKQSEFVGPGPDKLGMDKYVYGYEIVPYISDRNIDLS